MKKTVALVLMAALLLACTNVFALDQTDVVGTWYLNSLEMEGTALNPHDLGIDMTITFAEDGNATIATANEEDEVATWVIENDAVTLTASDEEAITLALDGETLVYDMGAEGKMVYGKEKGTSTAAAFAPAIAADTLAAFDGQWVGTQVDLAGMVLPLEAAEMALTLTVAEGTLQIDLTQGGETLSEEAKGELKDGALAAAIKRSQAAQDVTLRLHEDGTLSVTLGLDGIGVTIYCAKAEAK